jgi:hypothetical protein
MHVAIGVLGTVTVQLAGGVSPILSLTTNVRYDRTGSSSCGYIYKGTLG